MASYVKEETRYTTRMSQPRLGFFHQHLFSLFNFLVLITPFAFTWVNEELFEFNKMILTYALAIMIGTVWTIRMIVEQRLIFKRTIFDIPLALFLTSQVVSTLFSIHPYTSVFGYYTRFHGGLLSTLAYYLIYYAFSSNFSRDQIKSLLLTASLASLGVSLYAIPEHFGHSPSCLLITGGQEFNASCWIQDVKSRIFGTFGQPNWLAAYAITLIPIQWALILDPRPTNSRVTKGLLVWTSLLLFLTLLFTQSRSGQLGLVVGLGVFICGWGGLVIKGQTHFKKMSATVAGLLASIGLLAGIFGTNYTPSFTQLLTQWQPASVTQPSVATEPSPAVNRLDEGGTSSGEIRKIVWSGALAVAKRYPFIGSGVETFAYSYYQDRPIAHNLVSEWDFLYNKAHNEFLNFLATTGVFGLGTYCLLLVWFGIRALWIIFDNRTTPEHALLALGLLAGNIALSVSNFFGFSTVMVSILMYLSFAFIDLLATPPDLEAENRHRARQAARTLETTHFIGIGVTGFVGIYLLWTVIAMWMADFGFTRGKQYLQSGYVGEGLEYILGAIGQSPNEALFYDEVGTTYASIAVSYASQGEATKAAQLAQSAIATSDQTLLLNPRHLNFYKSRARIFITLAELNPEYLTQASRTLEAALNLSPTDAKLMYNLALVQIAQNQSQVGFETLKKTVALKPNYEAARFELGKQLESQGKLAEAQAEYTYILSNISAQNQQVKDRLAVVEASLSAQKK